MAASSPVDESRLGEINRQSKIGNSGASLICPCDRLSENERVPLILGLIPTLIDECDPKAPSSEMPTFHSQSILWAQHPRCAQEPLGKSWSAAGTTSRLIQRGEVLLQTALLGTVPLLELSRIILLR